MCRGRRDVDIDGDILDDSFEQLGYDSLALYQTVGQIGREWDVTMEEFLVSASETPRTLVGAVNKHIAMNADVRPSA